MMKILEKLIVPAVVALIAFAAGWYGSLEYYSRLFCVSELRKASAELAPLQVNIEALDRKDYESIRTMTNIEIDSKIILVNSMLSVSKSKEETERAKKWLSRVAKHRKQFPSEYPAYLESPETSNLRSEVEAILTKFTDYK